MGQIDTTLRYNGIYNSYEMGANDTLHASVFDTQYLSHITTQFVAVRVSGTIVDGWIEAIWIDANGAQVGSTQTVTWTPTRLWKRYTHTFAVPTGAVKVKLTYKSGAEGYHFSCPMTEAGEIASAYNVQVAAQLAYHTAGGSYIGFLNAGQIIAGILRSVDGSAYFDLDKPEIVMEGDDATVKLSPVVPILVTDAEGNAIAGLTKRGLETLFFAGALANKENPDMWFAAGEETIGNKNFNGIFAYHKDQPDVPYFGIYARPNEGFNIGDGSKGIGVVDSDNVAVYMRVNIGGSFADIVVKAGEVSIDVEDETVFFANDYKSEIAHDFNSAIGADGSGPYYVKSGTKTYLP